MQQRDFFAAIQLGAVAEKNLLVYNYESLFVRLILSNEEIESFPFDLWEIDIMGRQGEKIKNNLKKSLPFTNFFSKVSQVAQH